MSREAAVADALEARLGPGSARGLRLVPIAGGSINAAFRAECSAGPFFLKWNERPLPAQFAAEAEGLRALAASGSSLAIPEVIAHADGVDSFLLLEWVPSAARVAGFDELLGRGLAELHRASDPRGFGFERDGYCGATPQPNPWTPTWASFYREQRLEHQLRLSQARGASAELLRAGARLCARLDELLGPPEPPALIHGDLWSGNLHVDAQGLPGLVDPAAYYGHREAELGMLVLFGGFSERVFAAYDEAFPLAPGWRERLDLYTLYHVLNHYVLFGGSYQAQALRLIERYL